MKQLFGQVTIVGVGLIGGSIGKALKKRRLCQRVVGVARKKPTLTQAIRHGAIDRGFVDIASAVRDADLVVIATPPSTVVALSQEVVRAAPRDVILTDAASTKVNVVQGWERFLPRSTRAVGSHPMAGSEKTGVANASADLFDGALCIITPTRKTDRQALVQVRHFWTALGMRVVTMPAQQHDEAVAMVSHAPHLIGASLVAATHADELKIAATGFSDTTRVAMGDPLLWQDICFSNRKAVLNALARVERSLIHIRQALAYDDRKEFRSTLAASQRRRRWLSAKS